MMLDEPQGDKSTAGYSTGGMVAAPAAGRVIARTAPMLGLLPDLQDAAAINQELFIPMQPGRPPGAPAAPVVADMKPVEGQGVKPTRAIPARTLAGSAAPAARSPRPGAAPDAGHEAALTPPTAARLLPVSVAVQTGAAR
jgi:cell division protein FtsI (penicillin-binding protein 3)